MLSKVFWLNSVNIISVMWSSIRQWLLLLSVVTLTKFRHSFMSIKRSIINSVVTVVTFNHTHIWCYSANLCRAKRSHFSGNLLDRELRLWVKDFPTASFTMGSNWLLGFGVLPERKLLRLLCKMCFIHHYTRDNGTFLCVWNFANVTHLISWTPQYLMF